VIVVLGSFKDERLSHVAAMAGRARILKIAEDKISFWMRTRHSFR
jgi:hypothetical protein